MVCENCGYEITGDYEVERVIYPTQGIVEDYYYDNVCWDYLFGSEFGLTHTVMEDE